MMTSKKVLTLALIGFLTFVSAPVLAGGHSYGKQRKHVRVDIHKHRHSNAGAIVAGAIVAGAIAGAVARPETVVVTPPPVYVAPPVGSVLTYLPPGCSQIQVGAAVYQQCGGVYYQPFYQGGSLVYRVVVLH